MDSNSNTVKLLAQDDSKITNIDLYSGRAEITRLFEFKIKVGQNKVTIAGLPRAFHEDSLRVEGRGNASIHDVIIEKTALTPEVADSYEESILDRNHKNIGKDLESAKKSQAILNEYLSTIHADRFDIPRLEATLEGYMGLSQKIDQQILDLERDLARVCTELDVVKLAKRGASRPRQELWRASVNVHGQVEEEIKLVIKYAVHSADWTASYDIRVDTQAKEKKIVVLYKATIIQDTGESWNNAPLTLETASPSFGIQPPRLSAWCISVWKPQPTPQPNTLVGVRQPAIGPSWYRPTSMHMQQPPTVVLPSSTVTVPDSTSTRTADKQLLSRAGD